MNPSNPYFTFIAFNEGATRKERAHAYFTDFLEITGGYQAIWSDHFARAEARYHQLVENHFSGGNVSLLELRAFVDGIASISEVEDHEFEWLHDAFEWVLQ